jgi:hypothetical protein
MMSELFNLLPKELVDKIYEYDPTKRFTFDKVMHQMRMRQVWYEVHRTSRLRCFFPYEDWILCLGSDNPMYYMTEEMFEERVRFQIRWHRILGNKPRLSFDEFDLVSEIVTKQSNFFFYEPEGDDYDNELFFA